MSSLDPTRNNKLRLAILGVSGSIGKQALDVCRMHADKVELVAASVYDSVEFAVAVAREFGIAHLAVGNAARKDDAALSQVPDGCEVTFGDDAVAGLCELDDVDAVLTAIVGYAGITAGYKALKADKLLYYANKESIVVGGDILMPLAKPGQLIPVDSEHSAIFQCLQGERRSDASKLWLTCSGGPFFGMGREELASVTAADALKHPTWKMGAKITIDCSTLMNKGLEVIEAQQLFGVGVDDIVVLIHRQSIVHSMVEFSDGAVKAQLGPSDMRIPIQYAMSYPDRWPSPAEWVDYRLSAPLTFDFADEKAFGCLRLAKDAGRAGGTMPCALNAANEVANLAFRRDECGFLDVEAAVEHVLEHTEREDVESLDQLRAIDERSRALASAYLKSVSR